MCLAGVTLTESRCMLAEDYTSTGDGGVSKAKDEP